MLYNKKIYNLKKKFEEKVTVKKKVRILEYLTITMTLQFVFVKTTTTIQIFTLNYFALSPFILSKKIIKIIFIIGFSFL